MEMIVGFIAVEIFGLLFINFWGKKVIPSLISGLMFVLGVSNYRFYFDEKNLLNVFLPTLATFVLVIFILVSLSKIENLRILKEKSFLFAVGACALLSVVAFFIRKSLHSELADKEFYKIFPVIIILSPAYELILHEIVWKLILLKEKRVVQILLFVLATSIAIVLTCFDWEFSISFLIISIVSISGGGLFRYFFRDNSKFWVCVLIRGILYTIMFVL